MTRAKRPIVLAQFGNRFRIVGVLPPVQYGVYYSQILAAYGARGLITFTVDGELPSGIFWFQDTVGSIVVFGTTTMYGDYPITVTAYDDSPLRGVCSRSFVLRVMRFPMPSLYGTEDVSEQYISTPDNKPYITE